jgi:hypothetical protein
VKAKAPAILTFRAAYVDIPVAISCFGEAEKADGCPEPNYFDFHTPAPSVATPPIKIVRTPLVGADKTIGPALLKDSVLRLRFQLFNDLAAPWVLLFLVDRNILGDKSRCNAAIFNEREEIPRASSAINFDLSRSVASTK